MELKGVGTNMFFTNDSRHIIKLVDKLCGEYYYANHYQKIIKKGFFLNSDLLNGSGTLIKYDNNHVVMLIGEFTNDTPLPLLRNSKNQQYTVIESQTPYQCYDNNVIDYNDGIMLAKKEYYCPGIKHKYISTVSGLKEKSNKDVFLQLFVHNVSDMNFFKNHSRNVITDVKIIKELPATLHEMGKYNDAYCSLNSLLVNI